ncbi:hypothetical protein GCM10020258_40080 [Sphingomonas yabuuchiae]
MAGAVEEQVARDAPRSADMDRRDAAVPAAFDPGDVIADMPHAQTDGRVPGQQRGELRRIQMIGIVQRACIIGHPTLARGKVLGTDQRLGAGGEGIGDIAGQIGGVGIDRWHEGMVVAIIARAGRPSVEASPLFERPVAGEQQLGLGDADPLQRTANGRPGAFANPERRHVGIRSA